MRKELLVKIGLYILLVLVSVVIFYNKGYFKREIVMVENQELNQFGYSSGPGTTGDSRVVLGPSRAAGYNNTCVGAYAGYGDTSQNIPGH